MNWIKKFLIYLLPHHFVSKMIGVLACSRQATLKNFLIRTFIRYYQIDLNEAENPDINAYPTFKDFFIRRFKDKASLPPYNPTTLVCPVDGKISQLGQINDDLLLKAKGDNYRLDELLAHQEFDSFRSGSFMTFYLSPQNYHRVHMPFTGQLKKMIYVPGRLFSVNPNLAVPRVFVRNERVICFFETEMGLMAVIMIGALIVRGIHTKWAGPITLSHQPRTITVQSYDSQGLWLKAQEEMGYFELGSSVILLCPKEKVRWIFSDANNQSVKVGQIIGYLK